MILPNTRHRKWFGDHRQEQVINKGVYTLFVVTFLRKRIFAIIDVLWFSYTTTGKKAIILPTAKGYFSLSLGEQRFRRLISHLSARSSKKFGYHTQVDANGHGFLKSSIGGEVKEAG